MIITACIVGHGRAAVEGHGPRTWEWGMAWINSGEAAAASDRPGLAGQLAEAAIATIEAAGTRCTCVGIDMEPLLPAEPEGYYAPKWSGRVDGDRSSMREAAHRVLAEVRAAAGPHRTLCPYWVPHINPHDAADAHEHHRQRRATARVAMVTEMAAMVRIAQGSGVQHYSDSAWSAATDRRYQSAVAKESAAAIGAAHRAAYVMAEWCWTKGVPPLSPPPGGRFIPPQRFLGTLDHLRGLGYRRAVVFGGAGGVGEASAKEWAEWLEEVRITQAGAR